MMNNPFGRPAACAMALVLTAGSAAATPYVETYDTFPTVGPYAAIVSSPNGVTYDTYFGRAFTQLANYNIDVIGPGDQAFYWGDNPYLISPRYGLPGPNYSSDTTPGFLFNGYGAGVDPYELNINFTKGPTQVDSIDFGSANGSNAPAINVLVAGFDGATQVYSKVVDMSGLIADPANGLATLDLPSNPVTRLQFGVVVDPNTIFHVFPIGWYALDNLTYEISGPPSGGYTWRQYSAYDYFGSLGGPAPEPSAYILLMLGFGLVGGVARRSAKARLALIA